MQPNQRRTDSYIANIDKTMKKYMKQYFLEEAAEKQKANEMEWGKEMFGEQYRHSSCQVM